MLSLIEEAGIASWVTIILVLMGIAAMASFGQRTGRPGSIGAAFAMAVMASGALGAGTGQRMVDLAVHRVPETDLASRIELLSVGTREVSANLLLSGMGAFLLLIIGGSLALVMLRRNAPELEAQP